MVGTIGANRSRAMGGPVRYRSVQAQIHLTVIRARAELVSARTALVNGARGLVKSYGERLPGVARSRWSRELASCMEHSIAGCSGAVAQRNRIAERARHGIRRANGENRQGSVYPQSASLLKQVKGVGTGRSR